MISLIIVFMIIYTNLIVASAKNNYTKDDTCESVGPVGKYWSSFVVQSRKQLAKSNKVPKFVLTSWFERLGNHYIQMHRALRYAVCCRGRVRSLH